MSRARVALALGLSTLAAACASLVGFPDVPVPADAGDDSTVNPAGDATPGVGADGSANENGSAAADGNASSDGSMSSDGFETVDAALPVGPEDAAEMADADGAVDAHGVVQTGDGGASQPSGTGADADNAGDGPAGAGGPDGSKDAGPADGGSSCGTAQTECASAAPGAWVGPALLWTGARTATVPSCPAGYPNAVDGLAGLTFSNDTCSCQCTVSDQQCSGSASIYPFLNCGASCATVALSSGACVPFTCAGGAFGSWQVSPPVATAGKCTAAETTKSGGAPTWQNAVRVCVSAPDQTRSGGCSNPDDECLPAPMAPFDSGLCIYQAGVQTTCPAPYDRTPQPSVYYTGTTDGRGCSTCTCGTPSAGVCTGTVDLYGDATCGGMATTNRGACQAFLDVSLERSLAATYSLTSGTCSGPSLPPQPTGTVTATGALSVCCM
jgi:hypothetical protein